MCITISKQIFSVLQPIFESGREGIEISKLETAVKDTSLNRFARNLTHEPSSLTFVIDRALGDGEIEVKDFSKLRLTEKGERSYWYVYNKEISPLPMPDKDAVKKGRGLSNRREKKLLKEAVC